jgi:hypothetical protein
MSISTYAELKTAVEAWATYTDITSVVPDFIAYAHQEIARGLRANVLLATADITVNAEYVSPPTGFLAFKRLYLDTSPRTFIATISAEAASDMMAKNGTDTYPTSVAVEGSQLHFAPAFSGSATGKALYYKTPTVLSADGDTNVVLTKYPYLYLWGALEAVYLFKEDDNMADRWGSRFRSLMADINGMEARDLTSGPQNMTVAPGSIV